MDNNHTLSIKMSSKINWLVSHTSIGALVLQPWLSNSGISYSLAQRYAQSGWLKKLAAGVYYRPSATDDIKPNWVDAAQAVDTQLHLPVHVAGLSSLNHQGLSHYLPLGKEDVWLGVKQKHTLPKWFRKFANQHWLYCSNHKLTMLPEKDVIEITVQGKTLKASCPELAAYEVVDAIGKHISFEHAATLFQGLVNLSPRKVQSLLERSRAVQTNRVFLFLSHYYAHQWAQRLNETNIALGSGKRKVAENGWLEARYQITVPESLR